MGKKYKGSEFELKIHKNVNKLTRMLYCCHRLAKLTLPPLTVSLFPMWTNVRSWSTRPMYGISGGLDE